MRNLGSLPASSVILIMAVPCGPIIARADGLDRTAVRFSVPSDVSSGRLVKSTVRSVSPAWKVTTWLVIGVKSFWSVEKSRPDLDNKSNYLHY